MKAVEDEIDPDILAIELTIDDHPVKILDLVLLYKKVVNTDVSDALLNGTIHLGREWSLTVRTTVLDREKQQLVEMTEEVEFDPRDKMGSRWTDLDGGQLMTARQAELFIRNLIP